MREDCALREFLRAEKISVLQLSRALDVSPARVYQWLQGDPIPRQRVKIWRHDPEASETAKRLAARIQANGKRNAAD